MDTAEFREVTLQFSTFLSSQGQSIYIDRVPMDLFGDLPDPSQTKGPTAEIKPPSAAQNSGEKRKLLEEELGATDVQKKKKDDEMPASSSSILQLKGYIADRQGEREEMQDAHVIMDDFLCKVPDAHPSIQRLSLYCVFDGHGGARASRFASQHLHTILHDKFPTGDVAQVEKEIKKVLIETFKKTDEEFLKEARSQKPIWRDGSTAVVVLCINNTLYIANLGDSKAILCRYKESEGKYVGIPLTADQTPSVYEERMRIQKCGGYVKDGRVLGQLEVSRSLGDGPYKGHGVICVPDIKRCQLTENDQYILIACDGLWKSYSVDKSIEFVNKVIKDDSNGVTSSKKRPEDVKYETACGKLASSAVLKLSGDNVTVLLVAISKKNGKS